MVKQLSPVLVQEAGSITEVCGWEGGGGEQLRIATYCNIAVFDWK